MSLIMNFYLPRRFLFRVKSSIINFGPCACQAMRLKRFNPIYK